MKTCAIDMHHHYLPPALVEEAKRHGSTLGIEVGETSDHRATFAIAGASAYTLQTDLLGVEQRLSMMDDGKIAIAALEPHTASLAYGLEGQHGETWCRLYNEGIRDLTHQHPDRFCGLAAVPLQDPARAATVLQHAMLDLGLKGGYIPVQIGGIKLLLGGDIITQVNGVNLYATSAGIKRIIDSYKTSQPGDELSLTITRAGSELVLTSTVE